MWRKRGSSRPKRKLPLLSQLLEVDVYSVCVSDPTQPQITKGSIHDCHARGAPLTTTCCDLVDCGAQTPIKYFKPTPTCMEQSRDVTDMQNNIIYYHAP